MTLWTVAVGVSLEERRSRAHTLVNRPALSSPRTTLKGSTSARTMTKMAKRYAHFTLEAQRKAVETLDVTPPPSEAASNAPTDRPH